MSIDLNELASALGQIILRFRLRRHTADDWTAGNEVLLLAELGYETDTHKMKIGDGVTPWVGLDYWAAGGSQLSTKNAGVGIDIDSFQPPGGGDPYPVIKNTGILHLAAGTGIALTTQPIPGTGDDPDWANVSMLLHMDGDNGQALTYDSSSNALPITTMPGPTLQVAIKKFGQSAGMIAQNGGHWSTPDNAVFDMGAGDWTIESWFFPQPFTTGGTTHTAILTLGKFVNDGTPGTAALGIVWSGAGVDLYLLTASSTPYHLKFFDYVVPNDGSYNPSAPTYTAQNPHPGVDNQWNHIAVSRSGTKLYAWMNGWQMGINTEQSSGVGAAGYPTGRGGYDIGSAALTSLASPFNVGSGAASGSLASQFYGAVDEVRVTKGVARYSGLTFDLPTAAFWSTDTPVELETVITNTATSGGGGGGGGNMNGDDHPSEPTVMDDEFEGTTLDSKWSWLQQNTASVQLLRGSLVFTAQLTSDNIINALEQPLPAGDCSFATKFCAFLPSSNNYAGGIHIRETSSNRLLSFGLFNNSGSLNLIVSPGTVAAGYTGLSYQVGMLAISNFSDLLYMKIAFVGTVMQFSVSRDGILWGVVASANLTDYFTTRPDKIGMSVRSSSTTTPARMSVDFFRRIS